MKELANSIGIVVKGKKADIISQLSDVEEEELAVFVKERLWKLTEKGKEELNSNPYIQFFLEQHHYELKSVGVDIWTVNQEFVKNPNRPYRDIIYKQLNEQMNQAAAAIQKNPGSGTADTYRYCECYRVMGLFVEEEGKSYENASDLYFKYLFSRINIHAGLQLLIQNSLFKRDKERQAEIIRRYYEEIQIYPYIKAELLRLLDELGLEGDAAKDALITSFRRSNDPGVMNEKEAAEFVILELSGETDRSRSLAEKLATKAVKRV